MGKVDFQAIQKKLEKHYRSYVLITCGHPSQEGEMEVRMCYGGDAIQAAFLLEGAQSELEEQIAGEPEDIDSQLELFKP